jgi:ABC-type Fe3+ transport system substrate-binding protein
VIRRRDLLKSAALLPLVPRRGWAAQSRITVMTSYPQEVISRYVDAFGAVNPDTQIDIVWKSGDDARDFANGPGQGKIDVYWAPSVRTFFDLKQAHRLRRLDIDRAGLPGRLGKQAISDPEGYFEATEIAGYGFIVNPEYLKRAGLPVPSEWRDLTKAEYAGHIVMPVPSRVGFAPTITEIVLQAYGWRDGWSVLAGIAANSVLQSMRGDTLIGPIVRGEKGIALTIDFLASQAIIRGARVTFHYPTANAFEPANIAILADAPNPARALDFVRFVLSEPGQKLLIDPDLRRLAIRPDVYKDAPAGYFDPWRSHAMAGTAFDNALFVARRDLDNALFDIAFFEPRERRAALWSSLRRLEEAKLDGAAAQAVSEARACLTAVPIDGDEAIRIAPVFHGYRRDAGEASPETTAVETRWKGWIATNLEKASAALDRAEAAAKHGG